MKRTAIVNEEATKKFHEKHGEKSKKYAVFHATDWGDSFISKRSIYGR
jgi:hypothetical protein